MMAPYLTDNVSSVGTLALGSDELEQGCIKGMLDAPDKRNTMPRGGYEFGKSDARLRPVVPEGY